MLAKLKLAALLASTLIIGMTQNFVYLILFFCLIAFAAARFSTFMHLASRLKPLFMVAVFMIGYQLVFNNLATFSDRLTNGLTSSIRLIDLSLMVFFYTSASSVSEIVEVFSFLPRKWQLMLTITLSLIPVIISEGRKISLIQRSRGFSPNRFNIFANIFPVIIPLLNRTLKRSEQIALMLEVKGYDRI